MNIKAISPVFLTVLLTIYAQIIIKWQVNKHGEFPTSLYDGITHVFKILLNPWVVSGFIAAFGGAICWLLAMSKLPLNYIYPFIGLTIVGVLVSSFIFFDETMSFIQVVGVTMVILGLILTMQK